MNTKEQTFARLTLLATAVTMLSTMRLTAQTPPGIPEPGLIMYGTITNVNGNQPLTSGIVTWQVSGGSPTEAVTLSATLVGVNGQFFYVARVPFETRSLSGITLTKTQNTLALSPAGTPVPYTRSASAGGTNAVIVSPKTSSFTFSGSDRGMVERVNLQVSIPSDPNLDTDGDGMPDWAERIAGTDPYNASSVFKVSSDIQPNPQGGLTITWSSVSGKTYSVSRTSDLGQGFTVLPSGRGIPSGGATTSYTDNTATGNGPYFYRLSVE